LVPSFSVFSGYRTLSLFFFPFSPAANSPVEEAVGFAFEPASVSFFAGILGDLARKFSSPLERFGEDFLFSSAPQEVRGLSKREPLSMGFSLRPKILFFFPPGRWFGRVEGKFLRTFRRVSFPESGTLWHVFLSFVIVGRSCIREDVSRGSVDLLSSR